ncbi:MAG: cystathionine gamma-synthase family protein [Denitromonas halophila]|nr:MAG: cystathionine gamma-synthase family protein [Denitromonas halophila]TVT67078.1 MAG: cystathionine gamma-synthase family protein [Denitromonas halophila]
MPDTTPPNAVADAALHPDTQMISHGHDPFLAQGAVKMPVYHSSTFAFRTAEEGEAFFNVAAGRAPAPAGASGLVYSRFNHPNLQLVEARLALLDGAEAAVVTASGMAAISTALFASLRPGEQIVHSSPLYGGTETLIRQVMADWGVGATAFDDGLSAEAMRAALETAAARGRVGVFYLETPSNPVNSLVDFAAVDTALSGFAAQHGYRPLSMCDNTLLGPLFQQPLQHGIDLVIYSLTKYVGGHSDLIAGAVSGSQTHIQRLRKWRSTTGCMLDPQSSWLLARSMETLGLRMRRAAASASAVAEWLATQSSYPVTVLHPAHLHDARYRAAFARQCQGAGSTFSIVLDGGRAAAFRFINALGLFRLAVSLGGSESLVCHPASTTHSGVPAELRERAGVTEGLVRLSIGLEHEDDLIADLAQALTTARGAAPAAGR